MYCKKKKTLSNKVHLHCYLRPLGVMQSTSHNSSRLLVGVFPSCGERGEFSKRSGCQKKKQKMGRTYKNVNSDAMESFSLSFSIISI